jgi:hypothetical protein
MSTLQQQFNELIKNFKGKELEKVVQQILESDLYITSEFLDCPNIKALNKGNKYYDTLYLFSMLTYKDYKKSSANYLPLSEKLLNKLKCVSILELAKEKKNLDYTYLKNYFDIKSNYELEELLFNLISRELITGKVDAQNESVTILSVKPRCNLTDVKKANDLIGRLIKNLEDANEFLTNEENKIKEKTKELNGVITI